MIARSILVCIVVVSTMAGNALAAAAKVERIGAVAAASVSGALAQSVEDKGYRVTLDDGWTAEFWFAKQLKTSKQDVPGALYPELSDGEFIGLVNFSKGMSDYRGQSIPAGLYTLRYQRLPEDGNHMGVAPNPDFLLATPAANDSHPEQIYAFKKLAALSAKSTGTSHPAVIALESAGDESTVVKSDHGIVVFSVAIPTEGAAYDKIGIVIKGAASQ